MPLPPRFVIAIASGYRKVTFFEPYAAERSADVSRNLSLIYLDLRELPQLRMHTQSMPTARFALALCPPIATFDDVRPQRGLCLESGRQ